MESQLGAFETKFLGSEDAQHVQMQPAGTTAYAKDNARQIVGNIYNTYAADVSTETKLERLRRNVQEWLAPSQQALDFQAKLYRDSRKSHFGGTCSWYIGSQHFQEWLRRSRRLEWVHGGIGRGKTVLYSEALKQTSQHCHGHKATRVCYFYCTNRDPSGKDATVLLRVLLTQLLQPLTPSGPIMRLYDECHAVYPPQIPTTRDLMDTLFGIIQKRDAEGGHIYIMVDGLDEIPFETSDREEVLGFLSDLAGLNLDYISLFVTSRDQSDIQEAFSEPVEWGQTTMDPSKTQQDIESYLSHQMQSNSRLKRLSSDTKESIQAEISTKADGMFLWTALQISYLVKRRPLTNKVALDIVRSLPSDLNETYYRILQGINDEFTGHASRALTWLAFSSRTLFIEELVDACAVDLGLAPEPVLGARLEPYQLFELLNDLILIQPPLLSWEEPPRHEFHTVTLCHASVGEFLQSIGARGPGYSPRMECFLIEREAANLLIARACLAYLFHYNTPDAKSLQFPLLGYSWYRWERHVGVGTKNEYLSDENNIIRKKASDIYMRLSSSGISNSEIMSPGSILPCLNWLRRGQKHRLLDALNVPYFYPNFDSFFGVRRDGGLPRLDLAAVYQPMDSNRPLTRVLELLPCLDNSTTIRSRLIVEDLDDSPHYVAISYSWSSDCDHPVPMEATVHGVEVRLIRTQARILRLLRLRKEGVISKIWLDGLCISQVDASEKETQVALMGRIFSQAREVIVSLVEKPPNAAQGLAVLGKMAAIMNIMPQMSGKDRDKLRRQALDTLDTLESDGNARALGCLFQDKWWTRGWSIQEVVLASDASMLMGDLSFNFNAIESAVAGESILKRHLRYPERSKWRRLTAFSGWEAAKKVLKIRSEQRIHRRLPLHPLFWQFRHSQLSLTSDRLYALLGMCSPSDARSIPFDYLMSVTRLSLVFTRLAIVKYLNLDALSIASSVHPNTCSWETDHRLPSWAIDIDAPYACDKKPLVLGVFGWPQEPSPYAAMGPFTNHHQTRPTVEGDTFGACGYIFGGVLRVDRLNVDWESTELYGGPGTHDYVPHTLNRALRGICQRISHWTRPDGMHQGLKHNEESPTRVRWRTLLADQWPMGQRLAGGLFMDTPLPCTEEEEASVLLNLDIQFEDMPFLRGRAIILTGNHVLGLGPEDTRRGDLIAFLFGGSVPYILRPYKNHDVHYQLIGECYLHGYMDGEIMRENHETRIINIV